MIKLYYKIFVSCITTIQNSRLSKDIWKVMSLFYMTISMSLNVLFFWLIIQTNISKGFTDFLYLEIISNKDYNVLFNLILYIFLPLFILNYFLFFYKEKYLILIEKYPESRDKRLSGLYFVLSWFSILIYFIFVVL